MTTSTYTEVRTALHAAFNAILTRHDFPLARIAQLQAGILSIIDAGLQVQRLSEKQRIALIKDLEGTINGPIYAPLRVPKNPDGPTPEMLIEICQSISVRVAPPAQLPSEFFPVMVDLIAANR
jgi:hypothetical protein